MTMFKKVFGVVVSLLLTLNAMAYDFMAGGIAYNILSDADKTVEVTNTEDPTNNYPNLTRAVIPATVTYNNISYTVTHIGDYALYYANHANSKNGGLQYVELPNTITKIGEHAFTGLKNLTNFVVATDNPTYKAIDGIIFTTDEKELVAYPVGKEYTFYNIPQGVTKIGSYAFSSCFNLQKLIIPSSVNYIGDEAFFLQNSLTTIYCYAEVPPTLGGTVFSATSTQNVFVQKTSIAAYKTAEQWKDHNIQNGTISLDENSSETATQLRTLQGEYVYAELNRSFVSDGAWYTLCLPFALTEEAVEEAFGECELMKLNYSQKQSDDLLYVNFSSVKTIDAGTPYLFRPAENVDNPVFKGVTIDAQASTEVAPTDGLVKMTGIYSPMEVPTEKWYLGPNNTLYQPQGTVRSKGFRAYFELASSLDAQKIRARVVMNGQVSTDMDFVPADSDTAVQKIVENGHIYILRNSERYDVTGMRIN